MKGFSSFYSYLPSYRMVILGVILLTSNLLYAANDIPPSNGITAVANAEFRAGVWIDQTQNESSWEINRSQDSVYAIWYTYADDGSPIWYKAQGTLEGTTFQAPLLTYTWDYEQNQAVVAETVGEVSIDFPHPQLANLNWTLGESQGAGILRPFIFSSEPVLKDYSGTWYKASEPGYGVILQTQGKDIFGVLYYYDNNGKPIWASGNNGGQGVTLDMLTFQGSCPSCDYKAALATSNGKLRVYFVDESKMRVRINIPDTNPYWSQRNARYVMRSDPPSGRPHPAALASLASLEALKFYYKASFQEQGDAYQSSQYCYNPYGGPMPSPAPPLTPASNALISGTNNQVQGVEEPDVIKTTTEYLYSMNFSKSEMARTNLRDRKRQVITRYTVSETGELPAVEGEFKALVRKQLDDTGRNILNQGLYHYRSEGSNNKQLIYIVSQSEGGCNQPILNSTIIYNYDSSTDTSYWAKNRLRFDGELIASRRIGNKLFMTITHRPNMRLLASEVYTEEEYAELAFGPDMVADLFSRIEPEQLVPKIHYASGKKTLLVGPANIMMPPLPTSNLQPVLTTLVMLDLANIRKQPKTLAIMGRTDGVYTTHESVYFASSQVEYVPLPGPVLGNFTPHGLIDTDIHKIAISENALVYRGSGTVEGNVGSDPTRISYRMSEYEGNLRILSESNRWGELGRYRLSILGETAPDQLLLGSVASIPNQNQPQRIGKPGELLHSMRFFDDRAYAVTFQQIDPLYVFDLADASNPKILGELEIEGFSDYLHPVGRDLLIGVGMAAIEDASIQGAWIQGVQVGLFDVSTPSEPTLLGTHVAGQRGSNTIVRNDPLAFTFLAADPENNRPVRFIVPLVEHAPTDGIIHPNPSTWYPWSSTGVLMFEIIENEGAAAELKLANHARIASQDQTKPDDEYFYRSYGRDSARSVIYGEQVFHYFRGGLFATPWAADDFQMAIGCELCVPRN